MLFFRCPRDNRCCNIGSAFAGFGEKFNILNLACIHLACLTCCCPMLKRNALDGKETNISLGRQEMHVVLCTESSSGQITVSQHRLHCFLLDTTNNAPREHIAAVETCSGYFCVQHSRKDGFLKTRLISVVLQISSSGGSSCVSARVVCTDHVHLKTRLINPQKELRCDFVPTGQAMHFPASPGSLRVEQAQPWGAVDECYLLGGHALIARLTHPENRLHNSRVRGWATVVYGSRDST